MTRPSKSILVISRDATLSERLGSALSGLGDLRVDAEAGTLSAMNGRAVRLAGNYDIILFESAPQDAAEMDAIRSLAAARRPGGRIVALAAGDLPLARAREMNRAGVDEVVPLGTAIPGLATDIGHQLAGAAGRGNAHRGHIIAVTQARGGIGATTLAVNLASTLARQRIGFRKTVTAAVALLDLDFQFGSVSTMLDLPEQDTLLQMALDGTIPDVTFLRQSMLRSAGGVDVLGAPSRFGPLDALRSEQVAAIIDSLRTSHEFVVVDLPRALVSWVEPVLQRADSLMLVTDLSVPSTRHCRRLIDFTTADNPGLDVQVIVNHDRKPTFGSRLRGETEKALGHRLDHWLPHDPRTARMAADRGRPMADARPGGALNRAIARLATDTRRRLDMPAQLADR